MDSYKVLLFIQIFSALLAFGLLGYRFVLIPKRQKAALEREYPHIMRGAEAAHVGYLWDSDLAAPGLQVLQAVKRGWLIVGKERVTLASQAGRRWVLKSMDHNTVRTAFVDTGGAMPGFTALIRLYDGADVLYVASLGNWGKGDKSKTIRLFEKLRACCGLDLSVRHESLSQAARTALTVMLSITLVVAVFTVRAAINKKPLDAPAHITVQNDGRALMASSRELLIFDGAVLIDRVAVKQLGVAPPLASIAPGGPGEIYLGSRKEHRIYRCRLDELSCQPFPESKTEPQPVLRDAFAMVFDRDHKWLLVADSARHRLLAFDGDGSSVDVLVDHPVLCFPNQVIIDRNEAFVVNTNYHRIEHFAYHPETPALKRLDSLPVVADTRLDVDCPPPAETLFSSFLHREQFKGEQARAFPESTRGRVWPISAIKTGSRSFWVLNAANGMRRADLLEIDGNNHRLLLPGRLHDPVALAAVGDEYWVADLAEPAIHRFDRSGKMLEDLADPVLQSWFESLHRQKAQNDKVYYTMLVALLAILFLSVYLLMRRYRLFFDFLVDNSPTLR